MSDFTHPADLRTLRAELQRLLAAADRGEITHVIVLVIGRGDDARGIYAEIQPALRLVVNNDAST